MAGSRVTFVSPILVGLVLFVARCGFTAPVCLFPCRSRADRRRAESRSKKRVGKGGRVVAWSSVDRKRHEHKVRSRRSGCRETCSMHCASSGGWKSPKHAPGSTRSTRCL
ncbi:hypothetical protein HDK77DRAFT_436399, partial [Phyllosticta capitalensis]|uniref:uncharacterized protein n=1 Tax=Phyllosticta capitalensis TaxID=121624 RepID=UPI00312EC45F